MLKETLKFEVNQSSSSNQLAQQQSFQVPKNVQSISIEITTDRPLWLNYMVYDDRNELRAQFMKINAPQPLVIHQEKGKTSPYAISGEIHEGEWMIDIVIISNEEIEANINWCECKITFNDTSVEYTQADAANWQTSEQAAFQLSEFDENKVFNQDHKWYKGDFHTHTIYTDGEMTREENMVSAKNQNLDFFVATDHNLVPTSWVDGKGILVIPGVEVTSMLGHFNILNTNTSPFLRNRMTDMMTEEGMNNILSDDYGNSIVSINHPFLTEWKWLLRETPLDKVDTIEIWNDPTYKYNPQATEWALIAWNYLLNDGYKITGIGGSDSHLKPDDAYEGSTEPSLIGDPGTYVYCEQLSAANVVTGLRKGNVTVSRGEFVQFRLGDLIAGSTSKGVTGLIHAQVDTEEAIYFEWIVDGEKVKKDMTNQSDFLINFTDPDAYHWIRVDVRHEDGRLYGFSNPIYFGEKQPTIKKWGQILDIMSDYVE
ncbi:CehA/McbA family metallohydrolase [Bacillus sp. SD088]|uniref:CehA/McbA family metallohydrolase n=1 Tax=Bacillus sp. SD088 TaxID=2782012 RepID=UPI001A96EC14|nr:CehA/McbA family metallohydrolase [Bacillus sp. SD088]MBO0993287.1 PHP domain-containing protein [Bacillus sp. SD088]